VDHLTTQPVDKERRLALLLADGTGDYDFVQAIAIEETLYLDGHVPSYEHMRRAEQLARYVGYADIRNALRVMPGEEGDALNRGGR
jgi:hypothetical protein